MPQFKSLYGHSGYGVVRRVRDSDLLTLLQELL